MPSNKGQTITVGVTGASGAVFAQKTLAMLEDDPRVRRIHLVVTETGQRLFAEELRITSGDLKKLPGRVLGRTPKKIEVLSNKDVGASIASGSNGRAYVLIREDLNFFGCAAKNASRQLLQIPRGDA